MSEWQSIKTARKDGSVIDLWANGARVPDCFWGRAMHSCGEAGSYCDSDWHTTPPGWIEAAFNCAIENPTHWQPPPEPPMTIAVRSNPRAGEA